MAKVYEFVIALAGQHEVSFLASKFGEIANQEYFKEICRPNPHVLRVLEKVYSDKIEV